MIMRARNSDIAVIIVTYNSEKCIGRCIESILKQSLAPEIIVVDNGSTDNTLSLIRENYPMIRIINSESNLGYGKGNNLGICETNRRIVIVINPDARFAGDTMMRLVEPIENDMTILTTPMILLPDCETINASGLFCTPLGISFPRGLGEKQYSSQSLPPPSGISGCCFAANRNYFIELGGFDENFFMYNEDADISWRVHLKGGKILLITDSTVIHNYDPRITMFKLFQTEKNRYLLLRKNMPIRWIIQLIPCLIIADLISLSAFARFGFEGIRMKIRTWIESGNSRIVRVKGDINNLKTNLSPIFPTKPLFSSFHYETVFRKIFSKFLEANWRMIK